MKFIKISGFTLAALTLIFFAIGLLFPSVNYSATVTINNPLSETFALFNDTSRLKEWLPEVKSIEVIKEVPGKVGSQYKMIIEAESDTMSMHETVTAFEIDKHIGFVFIAGSMQKTDNYTFASEGTKTIITGKYECKGTTLFYKSMFSFFKGYFKEIDEKYLNNFKAIAEK